MFYVPSDAIAHKSCSLNLIQWDHLNAVPPSPEISPSLSPASPSCSSISSLKAWMPTSEQLQTPIVSFPHPVCRNAAAVTPNSSHEHSGLHISCVPMSAFDVSSSQEPTIPSVDEGELADLHWTTGIPCHMMDVFRVDPFTPPSFDNPTNPHCKIGHLHHTRSARKHVLSPDAIEPKRKTRTKRARIQSPPVLPFPATGPQEMFAYEFWLEIPYQSTPSSSEDYRRHGDLLASFSLARAMDDPEHIHAPRPVVACGPEDAYMRSPLEQDVELSLPPRPPYPCSLTASIPPKMRSEHHMQPHYPLFPVPLPTRMSLRLQETSNPAASIYRQGVGVDNYRPQFDEHEYCSLLPAVPLQDMQERAQAYRLSAVSATSLVQKSLYACPLCPRDFQLPNGLALHLKWHDRVGNITKNPTSHLSHRLQEQVAPRHSHTESGPLDTRDVRLTQSSAQDNGQQGAIFGLPSILYVDPQGANSALAESMTSSSHEQYTTSALSYERQSQECALFHDALQLNHNVDNNTYLAPLDGLSILQPLPFEQCHSTTGQLCAISPP